MLYSKFNNQKLVDQFRKHPIKLSRPKPLEPEANEYLQVHGVEVVYVPFVSLFAQSSLDILQLPDPIFAEI
jgi:hypothetical protein